MSPRSEPHAGFTHYADFKVQRFWLSTLGYTCKLSQDQPPPTNPHNQPPLAQPNTMQTPILSLQPCMHQVRGLTTNNQLQLLQLNQLRSAAENYGQRACLARFPNRTCEATYLTYCLRHLTRAIGTLRWMHQRKNQLLVQLAYKLIITREIMKGMERDLTRMRRHSEDLSRPIREASTRYQCGGPSAEDNIPEQELEKQEEEWKALRRRRIQEMKQRFPCWKTSEPNIVKLDKDIGVLVGQTLETEQGWSYHTEPRRSCRRHLPWILKGRQEDRGRGGIAVSRYSGSCTCLHQHHLRVNASVALSRLRRTA